MSLTGRKIGGIRIDKRLAAGGMGEVYLGFNDKLKRRVAVKTIGERRRLKEMTRVRFLREARALSLLDHPNICKIYDYLEEPEGDLLVLEYIEGHDLKELIAADMPRSRKLSIALQLLDALAAAHENGVIHRDIKPSNVIVTHDHIVKMLDFGISRMEEDTPGVSNPPQGDFEDSGKYGNLETRDGSLMGTLTYMSPEQARGETAGAAADIYALGLVIQEMLTGEACYDPNLNFSTLLRKVGNGESRAFRDPDESLKRLIDRMKAPIPEARPGARDAYEALLEITTRPARRRKQILTWAASAVLFAGALAMTWLAARIDQEAKRADREAARAGIAANTADEVAEFLVSLFNIVDPDGALGNKVTARELLDRGARRLADFNGPPLERARLLFTMGRLYRKLGLYGEAAPKLEQALALRREYGKTHDLDTIDSLSELAEIYVQQDRFDEAYQLVTESLSHRRSLQGPDHPDTAREFIVLARLEFSRLQYQPARDHAEKALALREKALPPDHPKIGEALTVLGHILDGLGEDSAALRVSERAVKILEKAPNKADLVDALNGLGKIHSQKFRLEEAKATYDRAITLARETLGPHHPRVGDLLNNIGVLYSNMQKPHMSMDYQQQALDIWAKAFGPNHSVVALGEGNMALSCLETKQPEKAMRHLDRAIEIRSQISGADAAALGWEYVIKARIYMQLDRLQDAREAWRHAISLAQKDNSELEIVAVNLQDLANTLLENKKYDDAESLFLQANTWWGRLESADGEIQAENCHQLAVIYRATDREKKAEDMEAQAKEFMERAKREGGS